MPIMRLLLAGLVFVCMGSASAAPAPKKAVPDKATIEAFEKLGARYGYFVRTHYRWEFTEENRAAPRKLPGFQFLNGTAEVLRKLPVVDVPHSKIKENIAGILKREGYINDFAVEGKLPKTIKMRLKYQGKKSVIEGLRRVSTPGLRRYVGSTDIPRVRGGLGVSVLSTSEGIMTGTQARKKNIGGELICYVW